MGKYAVTRLISMLMLAFLSGWVISAEACGKGQRAEKIAVETFDISDLKLGSGKIVDWGFLPILIIKKPNKFTPIHESADPQEHNSCITESIKRFIGENGSTTNGLNSEPISVLILLSPLGCIPTAFTSPSDRLNSKENEIVNSSGGIIHDPCTGATFDLNGKAINSGSVKSSNMLSPKHKINSDGTLTLGVTAN